MTYLPSKTLKTDSTQTYFLGKNSGWNSPPQNGNSQASSFITNSNVTLGLPYNGTGYGWLVTWVPELQTLYLFGSVSNTTPYCKSWSAITNTLTTRATPPVNALWVTKGGYDLVQRKIYVFGYGNSDSSAPNLFNRAYDPFTNTWGSALSTGTANTHILCTPSQSCYINGKFYLFGGLNSSGVAQSTLSIYDPATNAWSTGTPGTTANGGPGPRYGSGAGALTGGPYAGQMAVFGGSNVGDDRCYLYNPSTNLWTDPGVFTIRNDYVSNSVSTSNWQGTYFIAGAQGAFLFCYGGDKVGSNRLAQIILLDTQNKSITVIQNNITGYLGNAVFVGGGFFSVGDTWGFIHTSVPGGVALNMLASDTSSSLGS